MSNKSVRVQMSEETKQYLEALAQEYNCLYGGKPHISGLLAHIADGRLLVKNPNARSQEPSSNVPLILLKISLPNNIKGSLAIVVGNVISYFGGNIYRAKTSSHKNVVDITIALQLPDSTDLSQFIQKLQSLKIRDVANPDLNHPSQITKAVTALYSTNLYSNSYDDNVVTSIEEGYSEQILDKALVVDISCTVALRIVAPNQADVLSKILHEISFNGFYISSLDQEFDVKNRKDIIDVQITLQSINESSLCKRIEKITQIKRTLEKLPPVEEVYRINFTAL